MRGRLRRLGLGPVFVYEWITSARRWQAYAQRSLFLILILLALAIIWMSNTALAVQPVLSQLTNLARGFFRAMIGTMLAVVVLAAPAATAGAICLDRARGTLAHMLLTDLSDAEIVLGKLAARLVPVLTLIACTLPVMELLTLMGGVDPNALPGAFVVMVGVAIVGCSIAMLFSLWVGKTHQALLSTYTVLGLWFLARPVASLLGSTIGWPNRSPPETADPFYMAFAPYSGTGTVEWSDYLWFLGGSFAISALLIAVAVLRVRSVCSPDRVKPTRAPRTVPGGSLRRFLAQNVPWLTPSLDRNPVLWREWHRGRLSRWGSVVTCLYAGTCFLFCVLTLFWQDPVAEASLINGFQASIGFLLLSVTAATSLAEERARGGFDVLLTTPLSSRQIVLGKWLGAYRIVPLLAILPWLLIAVHSYIHDRRSWAALFLVLVYFLSAGGAITSLGLAMATLFSRLGRAVGMTVTLYVIVTVGAFSMLMMDFGTRGTGLALASPFVWLGLMTLASWKSDFHFNGFDFVEWAVFWTFVSALIGIGLLHWTVAGFDRLVGRTEDTRSRISGQTPPVRIATTIYFYASTIWFLIASLAWPSRRWGLLLTLVFLTMGKLLLCVRAAGAWDGERSPEPETCSSYRQIPASALVVARWLGAYRIVPAMVLFPVLAALLTRGPSFITEPPFVMTTTYLLCQSAAVVSFGVAMAARIRRPGQAVALTISFWMLIEIVGLMAAAFAEGGPYAHSVCMSSLYVLANMPLEIGRTIQWFDDIFICTCLWTLGYGLVALLLFRTAIEHSRSSSRFARAQIKTERGCI